MKNFKHGLTILALAASASVASFNAQADTFGGAIDLSSGSAYFGRSTATGSFTDTWTFTLASAATLLTGTATTTSAGSRDLDFSNIFISRASDPTHAIAGGSFSAIAGSTDAQEFYSLTGINLAAGAYDVIVNGINSPDRASYSGTLAISTVSPVPEPETYAMMMAGLGVLGFLGRRQKRAKAKTT